MLELRPKTSHERVRHYASDLVVNVQLADLLVSQNALNRQQFRLHLEAGRINQMEKWGKILIGSDTPATLPRHPV